MSISGRPAEPEQTSSGSPTQLSFHYRQGLHAVNDSFCRTLFFKASNVGGLNQNHERIGHSPGPIIGNGADWSVRPRVQENRQNPPDRHDRPPAHRV